VKPDATQKFFLNVLATVAAAAIVANVGVLWNLNQRLARIEIIIASQSLIHNGK